MTGDISTPDANRRPYYLDWNVTLRGEALNGALNVVGRPTSRGVGLGYWVELKKKPMKKFSRAPVLEIRNPRFQGEGSAIRSCALQSRPPTLIRSPNPYLCRTSAVEYVVRRFFEKEFNRGLDN